MQIQGVCFLLLVTKPKESPNGLITFSPLHCPQYDGHPPQKTNDHSCSIRLDSILLFSFHWLVVWWLHTIYSCQISLFIPLYQFQHCFYSYFLVPLTFGWTEAWKLTQIQQTHWSCLAQYTVVCTYNHLFIRAIQNRLDSLTPDGVHQGGILYVLTYILHMVKRSFRSLLCV